MSWEKEPLPLRGIIVFRLQLSADSEDSLCRKRRRDESTEAVPQHHESWSNAGFFFVPHDDASCQKKTEYLLIVPQQLDKSVCDAARFQHTVRITRYVLWDNNIVFRHAPLSTRLSVMKVQIGGLELFAADRDDSVAYRDYSIRETTPVPVLTLSQLQQIERSRFIDQRILASRGQCHPKPQKDLVTVTATIDAISPILAGVPTDPFALLELYDPNESTHNSCVAVLKGTQALTCHAGLQPGDVITLQQVRRQKWRVSEAFVEKKFRTKRVPTYVLVVKDSHCVQWERLPTGRRSTMDKLPSTVIPLVSLQGVVASVERRPLGPKGSIVIHAIDISMAAVDAGNGDDRVRLYLTFYPQSPSLLLGIESGAIIRAINVHRLRIEGNEGPCYGACLRSTVSLVLPSDILDKQKQCFVHPMTPFAFGKVRKTYDEYTLRARLEFWWNDDNNINCGSGASLCRQGSDDPTQSRPRLDQMVETAWRMIALPTSHSEMPTRVHRNPYFEFFDHACDETENGDDENTLHAGIGCHMSCSDTKPILPVFATLLQIKDACLSIVRKELSRWINETTKGTAEMTMYAKQPQAGWTASMQLSNKTLTKAVNEQQGVRTPGNDCVHCLFTCGFVESVRKDGMPLSLSNSRVQLPIYLLNDLDQAKNECFKGCFAVVKVSSATLSCLCLGMTNGSSVEGFLQEKSVQLPSFESGGDSSCRVGACALVHCHGMIFVVSIQLICSAINFVDDKPTTTQLDSDFRESNSRESISHTIQDCLVKSQPKHDKEMFVGLLSRQRYRFSKVRKGVFAGCALTLAHVPTRLVGGEVGITEISSLQSIELKLTVPLSERHLNTFQKCLWQLLGKKCSFLDEQAHLGTAWWRVADYGASALVVGTAVDDIVRWPAAMSTNEFRDEGSSGSCQIIYIPAVHVPLSAIERGNHGYIRFQCGIDELNSDVVTVTCHDLLMSREAQNMQGSVFTSIGGYKVLPGDLDRLPLRKLGQTTNGSQEYKGELLAIPSPILSGIPVKTLADLHWDTCTDIRNRTQTALDPSVVQLIRNARLVSVTYCRARAECNRCFEALVEKKKKGTASSEQGRYSAPSEGRTFWNCPLPIPGTNVTSVAKQPPGHTQRTPPTILVCPYDCPLDSAAVKWECSGIVDDGTGQAKLHAEREAAIMLLGKGLNVQAVEEGAWCDPRGIVFQMAVPPKTHLKYAILDVQASSGAIGWGTNSRRICKDRVWSRLSPVVRAEYALQDHCRFSCDPLRMLDFVVRCKPLSNEAFHLNRTQVEMWTPPVKSYLSSLAMDVPTYSLPPLKLNLVDCCVSQEESMERSWDLIRSLQTYRHKGR